MRRARRPSRSSSSTAEWRAEPPGRGRPRPVEAGDVKRPPAQSSRSGGRWGDGHADRARTRRGAGSADLVGVRPRRLALEIVGVRPAVGDGRLAAAVAEDVDA
jgi:hypothetical protein